MSAVDHDDATPRRDHVELVDDVEALRHELGNVVMMLDAAIRLGPEGHDTVPLIADARRRLDDLIRSTGCR